MWPSSAREALKGAAAPPSFDGSLPELGRDSGADQGEQLVAAGVEPVDQQVHGVGLDAICLGAGLLERDEAHAVRAVTQLPAAPDPKVVQLTGLAAGSLSSLRVHRVHLADGQPFADPGIVDSGRDSLGPLSTQPVVGHISLIDRQHRAQRGPTDQTRHAVCRRSAPAVTVVCAPPAHESSPSSFRRQSPAAGTSWWTVQRYQLARPPGSPWRRQ